MTSAGSFQAAVWLCAVSGLSAPVWRGGGAEIDAFPPAPDDEPILYANVAQVWHTPFDFTLDFGVAGQAQEGDEGPVVPVARTTSVKIPVSVIFSLARAIAENVDRYEQIYGPIPPSAGGPVQEAK